MRAAKAAARASLRTIALHEQAGRFGLRLTEFAARKSTFGRVDSELPFSPPKEAIRCGKAYAVNRATKG